MCAAFALACTGDAVEAPPPPPPPDVPRVDWVYYATDGADCVLKNHPGDDIIVRFGGAACPLQAMYEKHPDGKRVLIWAPEQAWLVTIGESTARRLPDIVATALAWDGDVVLAWTVDAEVEEILGPDGEPTEWVYGQARRPVDPGGVPIGCTPHALDGGTWVAGTGVIEALPEGSTAPFCVEHHGQDPAAAGGHGEQGFVSEGAPDGGGLVPGHPTFAVGIEWLEGQHPMSPVYIQALGGWIAKPELEPGLPLGLWHGKTFLMACAGGKSAAYDPVTTKRLWTGEGACPVPPELFAGG